MTRILHLVISTWGTWKYLTKDFSIHFVQSKWLKWFKFESVSFAPFSQYDNYSLDSWSESGMTQYPLYSHRNIFENLDLRGIYVWAKRVQIPRQIFGNIEGSQRLRVRGVFCVTFRTSKSNEKKDTEITAWQVIWWDTFDSCNPHTSLSMTVFFLHSLEG